MKVTAEPAAGEGRGLPLAGKTVVVTGKLTNYTRSEIERTIKKHGGGVMVSLQARLLPGTWLSREKVRCEQL